VLTLLFVLSKNGTIVVKGTAGIVLLIIATVFMSLLVSILLSRSITRPLSQAAAAARRIAAGELHMEIAVQSEDEVGVLATELNAMTFNLRGIVTTIQESSEHIATASGQISHNSEVLAEGAQSQATTLEETSASVEELTASVQQVSEHAQGQASAVEQGSNSMLMVHRSIENVAKNLLEIAELATKSVEDALQGAKAVSEVAEGINLIAGSSEKIGGIVTVISDIADQTNLLALNASIEAARAGEHGRGFAVVAAEVSKLADRGSSSTKEIESLIKESVKHVTKGVQTAKGSQLAMEQIGAASLKVKEMIAGLSVSMQQQVEAVKGLSRVLENISTMSRGISAATEEQTTNAKQVSEAVENVNNLTQGAASAAAEMSSSTNNLSAMAHKSFRRLLHSSRSPGAGRKRSKHLHLMWRTRRLRHKPDFMTPQNASPKEKEIERKKRMGLTGHFISECPSS